MPKGVKTELTPEQAATKKAEAEAAKSANFVKLANKRMNAALDKIALIGNLSSPSYKYTPEQITAMYKAMSDQVNKTFARFQPSTGKTVAGGFDVSTAVASVENVDEVKEAAE